MLRLARNFTAIFAVFVISVSTIIAARPPATSAESAGPRIIETTATSIVFELDVPQPAIDQVEVDGRVFDRVTLPGYASTGLPRNSSTGKLDRRERREGDRAHRREHRRLK